LIQPFHHFFPLANNSCPPRTFLPALCRILLDKTAPDSVLEVTARAITYYLDVSAECTRRVVAVDGAVKALCGRLGTADLQQRTSRDLAEQCVKVNYTEQNFQIQSKLFFDPTPSKLICLIFPSKRSWN
jgi:hypothetical protein